MAPLGSEPLDLSDLAHLAVEAQLLAAGGFARFSAGVVGGLPLPDSALADPALAELASLGAEGRDVQREIDVLTASHLALGPDARALRWWITTGRPSSSALIWIVARPAISLTTNRVPLPTWSGSTCS